MTGRPSDFTQEIADEICARLAKGEPLAQICRDEHMPAVRTVSDWKARHESFSAAFACAREEGFDELAAETLEIADQVEPEKAKVAKAKLRIETRLKLLAKWDPKRYGDKLDLTHGGKLAISHEDALDALGS